MIDSARISQITSRHRTDELSALFEISNRLREAFDLETILSQIIQLSCELLAAEASALGLVDQATGALRFHAAHGGSASRIRSIVLKPGQGVLGWVAERGEVANIPEVSKDPRFTGDVDQETRFTTRSILCVPMILRNEILGAIEVINKADGSTTFTESDTKLLSILAEQAALAIEHVRMQDRLIQERRLSAIGAMMSTIIHDIRNPMTSIKGFAFLLGEQDANNLDLANVIQTEADRITGMLKEILEFVRGEGTKVDLQEMPLGDFVDDIVKSLARDLEGGAIQLHRADGYRGPVRIDAERLRRVVFNLAGNARDAMGEAGGLLEIGTVREGDRVGVTVRDTGCGMDEETKVRIFEPFFTRGKRHGTGLGMAIVRNIVAAHGGEVTLESEVGRGTTFRIDLPAV